MLNKPNNHEEISAIQFTVEDDFSYFCKYDVLTGVVASSNGELPALADSCYVSLDEVFAPQANWYNLPNPFNAGSG